MDAEAPQHSGTIRPGRVAVRISLGLAFGIALFLLAHRGTALSSILDAVAAVDPASLGWAALVAAAIVVLRTDRLRVLAGGLGRGGEGPGWPRLLRSVLSESALRGLLDPRVSVKLQGRLLERDLPEVSAGRVVTLTRFGNALGLGLVGAAGLAWAGASGALDGWALWSGVLVVGILAGGAAVAGLWVGRVTGDDEPPEGFGDDEARSYRVLRETMGQGRIAWLGIVGTGVAIAGLEVVLYHFLFAAVGAEVEPVRLLAVAPAAALVSYLHFTLLALGLRDFPLVWILGGRVPGAALAAVGLLAALRVAAEALVGAPALRRELRP